MEEIKDAEGSYSGVSSPSFPNSPSSRQGRSKIEDLKISSSFKAPLGQVAIRSIQHTKTASVDGLKDFNVQKALIDTAAPFESVKEAVSKFGGILDWKAHKVIALEKSKLIQIELEKIEEEIPKYKKQSEVAEDAKTRVLGELDTTKRLVEELKHSLEKTETEEAQAKQDSELAQLRAREMEQGISDDASVAAKAQVEVSKARHEAAIKELKSVKDELAAIQGDYHRLVTERDLAIARAGEAVAAAKGVEKRVEDLTLELITTKEALESAHASHLEAEEHRIGIALETDQDTLNWEKELKQAEREMQRLSEQISSTTDLKSESDTKSSLLVGLKDELAAYKEGKPIQDSEPALASAKEELSEVHSSIEKTKDEVNCLRVAASSLKAELAQEAEALAAFRQREGMAAVAVSSLEAELSRMLPELDVALAKAREAAERLDELPKVLQRATRDAEQAKSVVSLAREELGKAREEAEQAKAAASAMEARLLAVQKETRASKASEKLALGAIKAMQESEQQQQQQKAAGAASDAGDGVSLSLEEYYTLSKEAYEAEEQANERLVSVIEQVKDAKKSELLSLERLEAAQKEMEEKKAALRAATEKAGEANEGKLCAEQELREWRAESEVKRRGSDAAASQAPSRSSSGYFEGSKSFANREASDHTTTDPTSSDAASSKKDIVPELKPKKKKSFFPRIVMFLARKKVQTLK